MIQRPYLRDNVAAYGDDFIVVKQYGNPNSKVFRKITGVVTEGKDGWLSVDGININPAFAQVEADLGVEDAPAATSKPKKKKAAK